MDPFLHEQIKNVIERRKKRLTEVLVRDVDNLNQLHYIRVQIKSLEDLLQALKVLDEKQEQ